MDHLFVFCPVLCIMAVHFLLKGCRSWIRQKNTRGHAVKSEGLPKGNTYYVVGGEGVLICFITSCTTSHKKKAKLNYVYTFILSPACLAGPLISWPSAHAPSDTPYKVHRRWGTHSHYRWCPGCGAVPWFLFAWQAGHHQSLASSSILRNLRPLYKLSISGRMFHKDRLQSHHSNQRHQNSSCL